jgi:hypothetical protein
MKLVETLVTLVGRLMNYLGTFMKLSLNFCKVILPNEHELYPKLCNEIVHLHSMLINSIPPKFVKNED